METDQTTTYLTGQDVLSKEKEQLLWNIARKRASFKWSALSYILVNSMLVVIWYLTSGSNSYFWPVWPILGWGLGIAMHYFEAYHGNTIFSTQKEFEKLKNQQNNQNLIK